MKKEEKKQLRYYELKDQYSKEFSELMIQRLGLISNGELNSLVFEDCYIGDFQLPMSYDGFKFVSFEDFNIADEYPDKIKVFDPYNDLGLANYCILQFMRYVLEIDVNNAVSIISISNNKMNELGKGIISFSNEFNAEEFDVDDNNHLIGHDYYRDSIKYLDLIYLLDGAADIEYNVLHNLDLVNYDKFELE